MILCRRDLTRLMMAGVMLASVAAGAGDIQPAERRSGYEFISRETRAMQDDDDANPGMLAVLDGEARWHRVEGLAAKSCAGCHGDARSSMKGVAARYPAFDAARGRPIDLEQRINLCRANRQAATPLPFESKELLALTLMSRTSREACRSELPTILKPGPTSMPVGRSSRVGRVS